MTVTFFGHKEIYDDLESILEQTLLKLIERGADNFLVGDKGRFDYIVRNKLRQIKRLYPHIKYAVVLAYMPKNDERDILFNESVCPEGLESVPPRFAIYYRNKWMLEQSDVVVTYVKHNLGGTAQFKTLAEKKGKTVINLFKVCAFGANI